MNKIAAYIALTLIVLFGVAFFAVLAHAEESAAFHPLTITNMVNEDPANWTHVRTHVAVEGFVTYEKHEADGDQHIRLCDAMNVKGMDRNHCIVAEIIPALTLPHPRKGQHITVQGISRFDAEHPGHHWWEVHPVESWSVVGG